MDYTVQGLASLSGVSIRTLRYYDEIGLLKPAYIGENNYRYYKKEQLFLLQQILFFKELGFDLAQIKNILKQTDFDKLKALKIHAQEIQKRIKRLKVLACTIDKTIDDLEGKQMITEKEMYYGFDSEQQEKHEQYLIKRHGKEVKHHIDESKKNVKNWSKDKWQKTEAQFDVICKELVSALKQGLTVDAFQVQQIIARHYVWLIQFWTPNKESYIGLGQGYTRPEWHERFASYHPELAQFFANAIAVYAYNNL